MRCAAVLSLSVSFFFLIRDRVCIAHRMRTYYSGIGINFTGIYIFDCAAWAGIAMLRGRLPASLLGHSACTSTLSVRRRHHRSGRLRRLLPSSLHLMSTQSVQPIMCDPPSSCDVHRRALRASSSSSRAAGCWLTCKINGSNMQRSTTERIRLSGSRVWMTWTT
jgi:hypothetical protein